MSQDVFDFFKENRVITNWDKLISLSETNHDTKYLTVLKKHDLSNLNLPIPLRSRYTRGRRWSNQEFKVCFTAWSEGFSLTLIAANLNRNPQDMIYKILEECKVRGIKFTQKGRSESSKNWNKKVEDCASELFSLGLPAWKIAVIFQVDFEYVEKKLYKNREGYGHKKKNPFSINTDHKQLVNFDVFNNIVKDGFQVLEPFAGEGRFTKILLQRSELRKVICIEENPTAFSILSSIDDQRCHFINDDNRHILRENKDKFDLIDLDPFSSCHEQLETIWKNLKDQSYLFLTFGGEYRRSFINSNRKSMVERYNFTDFDSANSEYLENIPYYFLGDVARRCSNNGFTFEVIRAVRYANYCRFWLDVTRNERSKDWFSDAVNVNSFGQQFVNVSMPRFKEIRSEIDKAKEQGFSL